ncbi:MAG TPA: ABC transporter substrate-binding protein [Nitrospinota bacterium]|nr:ABC transporter substrate-binding protein [Nitrospinota bacterium]
MRKKSSYIASYLLILLTLPGLLFAEEGKPMVVVKELLTAISTVKDESTTKLTPEEKKNNKKLMKKANSLIHISNLGPKTLGSHWRKRSPEEKEKFLSILTKLFEKVAYPKSAKFFTDLKIKYNNEIIKKEKAEIRTSMEHESEGLIEIDYKLQKINGKWLIYDVILDEVSLVSNLKTQFHKIIKDESFNELINRMQKRLEKED